jgi:hypothetical protein
MQMPKPSDWRYYPPTFADLQHRDNPVVVLPKLPATWQPQRGHKFEKQQKRKRHSAAAAIKNGPIEQALKSPAEVEFIRRVHAECTWMDDGVLSIKIRIRVPYIGDIGFNRSGIETLVRINASSLAPQQRSLLDAMFGGFGPGCHDVAIRVDGKRESAPLLQFTTETTQIKLGLDQDWDMLRRAVFGDSVVISNLGMMRALVPLITAAHTDWKLDTTVIPRTDSLFGYRDWTKWRATEKHCPSLALIDSLLAIVDSYLF